METIKIAGVKREAFGKKESKSIRKQGQVPCVIYGNARPFTSRWTPVP